jgi:LPPG:FO 2-phospho-L-lactate transferase
MRVVALAGGTGSAKLLRGLRWVLGSFVAVVNTGDNTWMHGLYICPDIDIATYTLAGVEDEDKGWGIAGDTFHLLEDLGRLGAETWFKLGDRDFATHVLRTHMLLGGKSLTETTSLLAKRLGVKQTILPPSDQEIETHIITEDGEMHLQEFWVKRKAEGRVMGVRYVGVDSANVTSEVETALRNAERIIFCPGNPITSLEPIILTDGLGTMLASSRARRIAVSPMIGEGAFSGPASKLMSALGHEPTSAGVAELYSGLIDEIIIDKGDAEMRPPIRRLGLDCTLADIKMDSPRDERRLAKLLLEA